MSLKVETPINVVNYTGNKALISNASKDIVESTVTSTEIGYLGGVTSGIQGQIDALASPSFHIANGNSGDGFIRFASFVLPGGNNYLNCVFRWAFYGYEVGGSNSKKGYVDLTVRRSSANTAEFALIVNNVGTSKLPTISLRTNDNITFDMYLTSPGTGFNDYYRIITELKHAFTNYTTQNTFVATASMPVYSTILNATEGGFAASLATARTLTIGSTGKTFNGTANVSWSLAEIGAQPLLTNPVTGTGTTNTIPKFTGTSTIGNSSTSDNGATLQTTNNIRSIGYPSQTGLTGPGIEMHYDTGNALGRILCYDRTLAQRTKLRLDASTIEFWVGASTNVIKGSFDASGNFNLVNLTASRVVVTDASKNLVSSGIDTTKLNYLTDVTSNIQAQLNGKQATLTNPVTGTGTTNVIPKFTGSTTLGNSDISDNGSFATIYGYNRIAGNIDPASFTPPDGDYNLIGWNRNPPGNRYFTLMSVTTTASGDAGFDFIHRKGTTEFSLARFIPGSINLYAPTRVTTDTVNPGIILSAFAPNLSSGSNVAMFVGKSAANLQSGGLVWIQGATDSASHLTLETYNSASPIFIKATTVNSPNLILTAQTLTNFTNAVRPTYRLEQAMATNDYWQIYGEGSGSNSGAMVFETGDDASEPFIWRMRNVGASLSYDRMNLSSTMLTVNTGLTVSTLSGTGLELAYLNASGQLLRATGYSLTSIPLIASGGGDSGRLAFWDTTTTLGYSRVQWLSGSNSFNVGSTGAGTVSNFWSRFTGSVFFTDGGTNPCQLQMTASTNQVLLTGGNGVTIGSSASASSAIDLQCYGGTSFKIKSGVVETNSNIIPSVSNIDLGTTSNKFRNIVLDGIQFGKNMKLTPNSTSVISIGGGNNVLPTPVVGDMLILIADTAGPISFTIQAPSGHNIRYRNADASYISTNTTLNFVGAVAIAVGVPRNGANNEWYLIW